MNGRVVQHSFAIMEDGKQMRLKVTFGVLLCVCALLTANACSGSKPTAGNTNAGNQNQTPSKKDAAALAEAGFRAQITLVDPPAKLRAGQKETIQVKIKNASDVQWYARGGEVNTNPDNRFYIAAGDRWLKEDGTLVTNMDGRYGLSKDLKPGEEDEIPLQITAPKEPGTYMLEVDLIQEQVAWFSDKGSQTARTKITVVR
jgi:hypothetical protein